MNDINTEIVELASEGFFYPTDSELSSGKVEMRPITAAEEDLLCSVSRIKHGLILPTLLSRILPRVKNIDSILQCDLETILLNARIINYGSTGAVKCKCSSCDAEFDTTVSFGFRPTTFAFDGLIRGENVIGYILPKSGKLLLFRLPNWREYLNWRSLGWVEFAKNITLSVEGEDDVVEFFNNRMSGMDSKSFRDFYETRTPGFLTKWSVSCPQCNHTMVIKSDVTTDIFNVRPESKSIIHDEIFSLCYHSNGAFTQENVYHMPVSLRNFYIKRLIDLRNAENDQTKKRESEIKAATKMTPRSIQTKSLPSGRKR